MANLDKVMPSWINVWLVINSCILFMDGGFCVLRPHSLPGGSLSTLFYGYKWYITVDKFYADASDSFIFTQGFGNLVEAVIGVLIVMNVFRTARLTKLVTMMVSVMTAYKTFIYILYTLEPASGGRTSVCWWAEVSVYGGAAIWIVIPKYVIWVLIQDFFDTQQNYKSSRLSTANTTNTSYDYVDNNISRLGSTPVISRLSSTPVKRVTTQSKNEKVKSPNKEKTPSQRYNLRDRN